MKIGTYYVGGVHQIIDTIRKDWAGVQPAGDCDASFMHGYRAACDRIKSQIQELTIYAVTDKDNPT